MMIRLEGCKVPLFMVLIGLLGLGGCIGIPPSVIRMEEESRQPGVNTMQKSLMPVEAFGAPATRQRNQ